MGKAPYDAELYFHALDREISAMLQRLRCDGLSETGRDKAIAQLVAAVVRRSRLVDEIVLPNLRRAGVAETLIDAAEQDCQAIWLLAEDLGDAPPREWALMEKLKALKARHASRVEDDVFALWPAARALGTDLISVANRLIAASYEDVDLLPRPRAARNRPADSALGLSSAARGESRGQGRPGCDSTAKSRPPRGRRTVRQGGKGNPR